MMKANAKILDTSYGSTRHSVNNCSVHISELYKLTKKWESVADTLPQVVDRLSSLKDLHEQALQFSQALAYLDTTQQEINLSLTSHGDILKQLEGMLKQNMDTIKSNAESLDKRMKTLKK